MLEKTDKSVDEALMVGDNLLTDILGSSRVGMRSVWINRTGKQGYTDIQPTFEITHLEELFSILDKLEKE